MGDEEFIRTVGERSLTKLYDQATTLLALGQSMRNVTRLRNVLAAIDLVIGPLSANNIEFQEAKKYIMEQMKSAIEKEGRKAVVESAPLTFGVLKDWFRELNMVIDDNNLLFASSSVYQEISAKKHEGGLTDETSI